MVGAQPLQRVFRLFGDPRWRCVAADLVAVPFEPAFAGDRDPFAAAIGGERPADDLFGTAAAVNRCGIDQIDAAVDRSLG